MPFIIFYIYNWKPHSDALNFKSILSEEGESVDKGKGEEEGYVSAGAEWSLQCSGCDRVQWYQGYYPHTLQS